MGRLRQEGGPPANGTAQTAPAEQSAWVEQLPPAGAHSGTPSPQRSVQLEPLAQSADVAQGPKGPHIASMNSGWLPHTSPAPQSALVRQSGPVLMWQIVAPVPVTSRHIPKKRQPAELTQGGLARTQKGTVRLRLVSQ